MALKGPGLVLPGDLPCHHLARLAFAGPTLLSALARRATAGSEWPGRQPRPVAPFLPGGGDTAPLVAQQSIEDLGQSVVVANDGGAGTVKAIAERGVPADGYTILYGTPGTLSTNPLLLANLPYDAEGVRVGQHGGMLAPCAGGASLGAGTQGGGTDHVDEGAVRPPFPVPAQAPAAAWPPKLLRTKAGIGVSHIPTAAPTLRCRTQPPAKCL